MFFLTAVKKSKKDKKDRESVAPQADSKSDSVDFMIQPESVTPKIDTTK